MPVVAYNVYAQPADESTPRVKVNDIPVADIRYVLAGLPSRTDYHIWATAIDDAGLESDLSAMLPASTLEYPTGSELSPGDSTS